MAIFSQCLHMVLSLCVCVLISSSYKDNRYIGLRLTIMTSLELKYLFKDPILKLDRAARRNYEVLRLGLQLVDFMIFSP